MKRRWADRIGDGQGALGVSTPGSRPAGSGCAATHHCEEWGHMYADQSRRVRGTAPGQPIPSDRCGERGQDRDRQTVRRPRRGRWSR